MKEVRGMALAAERMEFEDRNGAEGPLTMKEHYLEALKFVERLHRLLLDVIKDELERLGRSDINSVQALLLFNIGDSELTAGELKTRGYYQGSNVSYNLKKLVEAGYIDHQRSNVDRRSVRVKLTDRGREIAEIVDTLYQKHTESLCDRNLVTREDMEQLNRTFRLFERFWSEQIRFRY